MCSIATVKYSNQVIVYNLYYNNYNIVTTVLWVDSCMSCLYSSLREKGAVAVDARCNVLWRR